MKATSVVRGGAAMALASMLGLAASSVSAQAARDIDHERPPGFASTASGSTASVEVWYGWQTLSLDLASVALVPLGLLASPGFAAVGMVGILFAGPVVHFAHDNPLSGAGSIAMRLGSVLVAAAVGHDCLVDDYDPEIDGPQGACDAAAAVLIGGLASAIVIDAALLAYEDVSPGVTLGPHVVPERGVFGLAVRGPLP